MRYGMYYDPYKKVSQKDGIKAFGVLSLMSYFTSLFSEARNIFVYIMIGVGVVLVSLLCIPPLIKKYDEEKTLYHKRLGIIGMISALITEMLLSNQIGKTIVYKFVVFGVLLFLSIAIIGIFEFIARKKLKNAGNGTTNMNTVNPAIMSGVSLLSGLAGIFLYKISPDIKDFLLSLLQFILWLVFLLTYSFIVEYRLEINRTLTEEDSVSEEIIESETKE